MVMRKSFGPVRILTLWATFVLSAMAQQNIIQNGDFETPSDEIAPWDISSGDVLRTENGYSGWGLTLASTSTTTPAVVSQPVNATAQRAYQISLWAVYYPPTDTDITDPSQRLLSVDFGENNYWTVDAPTASWKVFTFEGHGTSPDDLISLTGYDLAGGRFVVDNVCLLDSSRSTSPTPSPSSSSPASDDPGATMNKVGVIWGVVGSIIAAVASVATIYMCLDRLHRTRLK